MIVLNEHFSDFVVALLVFACIGIVSITQYADCRICVLNKLGITAVLAEDIAPAVYLASGSYFNMEVIIDMCKLCINLISCAAKIFVSKALTTLGAVADSQALIAAGCFLCYHGSVLATGMPPSYQLKASYDYRVSLNLTTVLAYFKIYTGSFLLGIFLNFDSGVLMLTLTCWVCQTGI